MLCKKYITVIKSGGGNAGRAGGFTLLELLVVLGIIAIVSAMVVPRFGGALHGAAHKTAAKKIAATLRYARSRAVAEGVSYTVNFDLDNSVLSVGSDGSVSGDDDARDDDVKTSSAKTYVLPAGVSFAKITQHDADDIDEGVARVNFYPSGASSGGEIWIQGEEENYYVLTIDFITGVVHMERTHDIA